MDVFPPAHPGLAYLLYAGWLRTRGADPPGEYATLALVVGALLSDLLDQSLYHLLGGLPSTRTLGHSLLFVLPVTVAVVVAVRRSSLSDDVATGFAVGLLSHPAADATFRLLLGNTDELGFLLWPVTHSPPYDGNAPLLAVGDVTVTTLWIDLVVLAAAVVLWWRDGRPGVDALRGSGG